MARAAKSTGFLALVAPVLAVAAPAVLTAQAPAPSASAPAPAAPADRLVAAVAPVATVTGRVDLGEIAGMTGYVLVQTLTTVPPQTGRPLHSHAGMPEIVRVVSGTLTDSRNGEPPLTYGPGSTIVNDKGTRHMWANFGTEPVVLVSAQVRPAN